MTKMFYPAMESVENTTRCEIGKEIISFLAPHIAGLDPYAQRFITDLVHRRAVKPDDFFVSQKQFDWLIQLAFANGFRATDRDFWKQHAPEKRF